MPEKQQRYLDHLIRSYTGKTAKSKEMAQAYRGVLADNRASAGFRYSIKEMLYPLHARRSSGAHIWDVDGNKYVDLTMGFGVNLFGHNPAFVMIAIDRGADADRGAIVAFHTDHRAAGAAHRGSQRLRRALAIDVGRHQPAEAAQPRPRAKATTRSIDWPGEKPIT